MDVNGYLSIAIEAAKEAGDILRKSFNNDSIKINSNIGKDIKLQSDVDSEKIIIQNLQSKTNFSILSEEFGFFAGNNSNGYQWIIDPLDGSLNYSRGIDVFCISIGLWQERKPILGIVYDFLHDNLYTGIVGKGASKNGLPISVSEIDVKEKAIICTGFPVYRSFETESLLPFLMKLTSYKKVRLLGSAALSLSYVAQGSTDVYTEEKIAFWDVAAGIALVLAAGGECNYHFYKDNPNFMNVFASNKNIHEE